MTLERIQCRNGHPWATNKHRNKRGNWFCRACANGYPVGSERVPNEANNDRSSSKRQAAFIRGWKSNARNEGRLVNGYSAGVLKNTGREKLEAAFNTARETGSMAQVYPIVGSMFRWQAIRTFDPRIGKRMDAIIAAARAQRKAALIKPARPAILRLNTVDLLDRINSLVPRGLARDQRMDIISDMTEAVLSGRLQPDQLAQNVTRFVRANFQSDHNKFGPLSLDMPAFRDGETPLIESIVTGLWS